jgi:periplasmic protein TonB
MMKRPGAFGRFRAALAGAAAALLAACTSSPPGSGAPGGNVPVIPGERTGGMGATDPDSGLPVAKPVAPHGSTAANARSYRRDAATHLYGMNAERIYSGRLPPMLYAVGVLEVDVGTRGEVRRLHWLRAPRHAPEVIAEIERTVRAAAPFPAPLRMGRVTYTDTWLWHKSGRFQLDTLTEGQD